MKRGIAKGAADRWRGSRSWWRAPARARAAEPWARSGFRRPNLPTGTISRSPGRSRWSTAATPRRWRTSTSGSRTAAHSWASVPTGENPDPGARFHWRGEIRSGQAYWIGDPLIPGDGVTLTILVRPDPGSAPRLRVVHWPTDGRDQPVGPETCAIWGYDTESREASSEAC